jgi:galactokinase
VDTPGPTRPSQLDRAVAHVVARFREATGREPETVWSAPGRANLIGEHTDYNDGFVLPFALARRVFVAAGRRSDGSVVARSIQAPGADGAAPVAELTPSANSGGWLDYPFGVVWALRELGDISGIELVVDGHVPLGAGVSSSAALECAIASAVAELCTLPVSRLELARACQRAENEFVGVPSGVMDQLAALFCVAQHALFLDTRTLAMRQVALAPAASRCVLMLIDTRIRHALASTAYADRRRACEAAALHLGVPALRDVELAELDASLAQLDDPVVVRRVRHVVTENARVLETVRLLKDSRFREVGALLDASHASLRDDFEVSCRELDLAVGAAKAGGALGARMIGGGFGGSVLALVDAGNEARVRVEVNSAFAERSLQPPEIEVAVPGAGSQRHEPVSERLTAELPT